MARNKKKPKGNGGVRGPGGPHFQSGNNQPATPRVPNTPKYSSSPRRAAFELVEACRLHEMRRLAAVITDAQTLGPIGSWEGEDDVGVNL